MMMMMMMMMMIIIIIMKTVNSVIQYNFTMCDYVMQT